MVKMFDKCRMLPILKKKIKSKISSIRKWIFHWHDLIVHIIIWKISKSCVIWANAFINAQNNDKNILFSFCFENMLSIILFTFILILSSTFCHCNTYAQCCEHCYVHPQNNLRLWCFKKSTYVLNTLYMLNPWIV